MALGPEQGAELKGHVRSAIECATAGSGYRDAKLQSVAGRRGGDRQDILPEQDSNLLIIRQIVTVLAWIVPFSITAPVSLGQGISRRHL